jgi:hypothetical protein
MLHESPMYSQLFAASAYNDFCIKIPALTIC